jgi:hypothetical protein
MGFRYFTVRPLQETSPMRSTRPNWASAPWLSPLGVWGASSRSSRHGVGLNNSMARMRRPTRVRKLRRLLGSARIVAKRVRGISRSAGSASEVGPRRSLHDGDRVRVAHCWVETDSYLFIHGLMRTYLVEGNEHNRADRLRFRRGNGGVGHCARISDWFFFPPGSPGDRRKRSGCSSAVRRALLVGPSRRFAAGTGRNSYFQYGPRTRTFGAVNAIGSRIPG